MKKTSKKTKYRKIDEKKTRARVKRLKRFLVFAIFLIAVILFARSSFFIINKIDVTGNKKYSGDIIVEQSGLKTGNNVFKMLGEKPKNLFTYKFHESEQSIYRSFPYIKTVSVRPALPDAIKIKIVERTPFAVVETSGTSLLIDKEGYALEEINANEFKGKYLKLKCKELDSYKLGQQLKFKKRSPLNTFIDFYNVIIKNDKKEKLKLFEKISSVSISEINNIVVLFDDRITVKFGDMEDIDYKINFFRQLFTKNITPKQKGTIDFTKSSNPFFTPVQ